MSWKISVVLVIVAFTSCRQDSTSVQDEPKVSFLIEAEDMRALIEQPNMKVLDFRKKLEYDEEHIVGAVNIWRADVEDPSYDYCGMMATPNQIERLFGQLGIRSNDTLIIYDDNGLCNASRLWWILQNYDYDNVRLLHGGIEAWKAAGGEVTDVIPTPTETVFQLADVALMKLFLSKEEMRDVMADKGVILDTRSADEFSGKRQKKGAARGGRIPGSIHIDWAAAIDYQGDKRIKSIESLEKVYGQLEIAKDTPLVVYCHSGVRSAHTTFVLTQLLGYENVKNYDGSWTEWSYFENLPVELDSLTQI